MTDTQTALLATIRGLGQHHINFQAALAQQIQTDPRLTPADIERLTKQKFNHSQLQILSLVNQTGERAYTQLTELVPFSQGMLSRYVKQLLEAGMLTKVALPDNKKAYHLAITSLGQVLAEQHDQLHERENHAYQQVLAQFSEQQINDAITILKAIESVRTN